MNDLGDLNDQIIEVASWFEIDLNKLVIRSHELAIKGIRALEQNETAEVRETFEAELVEDHIRFLEWQFGDMIRGANNLVVCV